METMSSPMVSLVDEPESHREIDVDLNEKRLPKMKSEKAMQSKSEVVLQGGRAEMPKRKRVTSEDKSKEDISVRRNDSPKMKSVVKKKQRLMNFFFRAPKESK